MVLIVNMEPIRNQQPTEVRITPSALPGNGTMNETGSNNGGALGAMRTFQPLQGFQFPSIGQFTNQQRMGGMEAATSAQTRVSVPMPMQMSFLPTMQMQSGAQLPNAIFAPGNMPQTIGQQLPQIDLSSFLQRSFTQNTMPQLSMPMSSGTPMLYPATMLQFGSSMNMSAPGPRGMFFMDTQGHVYNQDGGLMSVGQVSTTSSFAQTPSSVSAHKSMTLAPPRVAQQRISVSDENRKKKVRHDDDAALAAAASSLVSASTSRTSKTETDDSDDDHGVPEETYGGERRLIIHFSSYGTLGRYPQKIGKRNAYIPDGISGRFKMYHENFVFKIDHGTEPVECRDGVHRILIKWTVINEPSEQVTIVLETPQDALRRQVSGKTICNRVYKEVLERRALSYEQEMKVETSKPEKNEVKIAHLASMIKLFRPKTFSLGPLAFGLLHSTVQERMLKELAQRTKQGENE